MSENGDVYHLEMPKIGIIKGVLAKDIELVGGKVVNVRTCARPYSNVYSVAQLRVIRDVIENYGSGKVHLSPRHNLEIPEVRQKRLKDALRELYIAGLFPGGAGTSVRNIFTCPDWCSRSIRPVQELGEMISANFGDRDMHNKVTISFAGCANSCSRPHNCDIGIIAAGKVSVADEKCPDDCSGCIDACRFRAMDNKDGRISINERCTYCCRCVDACQESILAIEETGFRVLAGGKEGSTVKFGQECASFADDFEVLELIERILSKYENKGGLRPGFNKKKERLGEVIERLGLEGFLS